MNKTKRYSRIATLLILLFLVGCIKEDLSNCERGLKLSFGYKANTDKNDSSMLSDNIDSLSIYIFDSKEKFVGSYKESTANIEASNSEMTIPLEKAGIYKIITLGDVNNEDYYIGERGKSPRYLIPSVSDIDDFKVGLTHSGEGAIDKKLGGFYISGEQEIVVENFDNPIFEIDLIKNVKTINFKLEGIDDVPNAQPVIKAKNSLYDKNNNIIDSAPEITYRPYEYNEVSGIHVVNTLRIIVGVKMPLTIMDGDDLVINNKEYDLVDLIMLHPDYSTQKSIDEESVFDIGFIRSVIGQITITVNGWTIITVKPEM